MTAVASYHYALAGMLFLCVITMTMTMTMLLFTKETPKQTAAPSPPHRPRKTAVFPGRPPTRMDRLLADLINAQNAEMRSIELGQWALQRLRMHIAPPGSKTVECSTLVERLPYDAIAAEIPGINAVARNETARILREIAKVLAAQCRDDTVPVNEFLSVINLHERAAFHPTEGLLWGMNGYAATSPRSLP